MTRLNLLLLMVLIMTALGTVTAQHQSRKLYSELQAQQEAAKQYREEWVRLQIEQSTWAKHDLLEKIANDSLHMQVPDAKRIQLVFPKESNTKEINVKQVEMKQPDLNAHKAPNSIGLPKAAN